MNGNSKSVRKLKSNRLRLTQQRKAVFNVINNSQEYFTPAAMFRQLEAKNADVSLVTVYRSLNMLHELGLVCEIRSDHNARSYGKCLNGRHGHIICNECGKTVAYNGCWLNKMTQQIGSETGFSVAGEHLILRGLCQDCQTTRVHPQTG
jgi:Fur family transcriptional regulator, ferric uptake regulator